MTKEQKIAQRDAEIDQIIDRFDMTTKCNLTREQIHQRVIKGMVSTNLAHVMADAANSLLLDAEDVLRPMQVCFSREDKYHYKQMLDHITAAKKWAAKSAFEPYQTAEADLFAQDSDWWYNIIRLIEDRTGDNVIKTKQVLQWLLTMPSEMNLFKIKMSDFKRSLYDIPKNMIGKQKTKDEGYVSVATKVPAHVAELLTILARMRGMEVYELLQLLVNGFISYAKAENSVPEEFRHLYESLKFDVALNQAFNFASPTAASEIAQMVLVLQQPGKKGFGMMMINKPFIDEATCTLSVPLIAGRVLELSLGTDDFKRLRGMVAAHESSDPLDMIRLMLDAQEVIDIEESNRRELPGHGEHHDYGKVIEYGNKHKRIHHKSPDSIAQQQTIVFDDYDREVADYEVKDWEGEHRQTEEPPEGMTRPFDQEW